MTKNNLDNLSDEYDSLKRKRRFSDLGIIAGGLTSLPVFFNFGNHIWNGYIAGAKYISDLLSISPSKNVEDISMVLVSWGSIYFVSYAAPFFLGGKAVGEYIEKKTRREGLK